MTLLIIFCIALITLNWLTLYEWKKTLDLVDKAIDIARRYGTIAEEAISELKKSHEPTKPQ